jgi:hypothetical protein
MDQDLTVAFVRGDDRRGAVAEALALVAHDLRAVATASVVFRPGPACHADTLSAALDALFHAGGIEAVVVEPRAVAERRGHRREAFGRPVRFVDPDDRDTKDLLSALAGASCAVVLRDAGRPRARGLAADLGGARPGAPNGGAAGRPSVLLVDAFGARRAVIAGTDAAAVAAVAAVTLGDAKEPSLAGIRVVGDPLAAAAGVPGGRRHAVPRSHAPARRTHAG